MADNQYMADIFYFVYKQTWNITFMHDNIHTWEDYI